MSLFNIFKYNAVPASHVSESPGATFSQQEAKAGLLVTDELDKALEYCKARVARISAECRAKNRKFRDLEFDMENDKDQCLHGLESEVFYTPSDVRRVTQIFDEPKFFIDGAHSSDIAQGAIGDCWFVSALSTISTPEGLVEKFCVARDELVGVYGFIFFRDGNWVTVIIDDLLFTAIPRFEELTWAEKKLYHHEKDIYNKSARKGSKSLYFARSSTQGETWVPLLEKAYAKLHGNYAALGGGWPSEAVEDLTGGVSSYIATNDIFDIDKFWNEELLRANTDRLFSCISRVLDTSRSGNNDAKFEGIIANHAYSVIRAVEVKGKRFVIVRNPWGDSEWTGRWSDGSKEWTSEWLAVLPQLDHTFGDDGTFIQEYSDFLECWREIDRTLLFDSSWIMSCQWLHVQARPLPSAWTYGDVSFQITIPAASPAIIVLSQIDSRYFKDISGRSLWTFDFLIFKKGEKEPLAESAYSRPQGRSANLEINLEAGDYVVHVRLDRRQYREKNYFENKIDVWDSRKLSRVLMQRALGQSNAINFKADSQAKNLPLPIQVLAGQDLAELEKKALAIVEEKKKLEETEQKRKEEAIAAKLKLEEAKKVAEEVEAEATKKAAELEEARKKVQELSKAVISNSGAGTGAGDDPKEEEKKEENVEKTKEKPMPEVRARDLLEHSEDDSIVLGLRVYTKKGSQVVISGHLRHEMEVSAKEMMEKLALP